MDAHKNLTPPSMEKKHNNMSLVIIHPPSDVPSLRRSQRVEKKHWTGRLRFLFGAQFRPSFRGELAVNFREGILAFWGTPPPFGRFPRQPVWFRDRPPWVHCAWLLACTIWGPTRWWFVFFWEWNPTHLYWDYKKPLLRIPINQPVSWKVTRVLGTIMQA